VVGGIREGQRSGPRLGEVKSAGDDAADGEVAAVDGDRAVARHRDGARAEIQILRARECEIAIPRLQVVRRERDGGGAAVVDRAAVDCERCGTDCRGVVDVEGSAVQCRSARVRCGAKIVMVPLLTVSRR